MRAVCKASPVKAPGPGGFTGLALHAALCLAQHHSAWWPESAWLTSSCNFRNPGNKSPSGAEFCSLNERFSTRLWRAKRRQTADTHHALNAYAGHKKTTAKLQSFKVNSSYTVPSSQNDVPTSIASKCPFQETCAP